MLVFHYSHPTTPAGPGFDTVIADAVEIDPSHSLTEAAAMGDAAVVNVNVDDPAAAYDFRGLHRWYAVETDCPSDDHYAWDGYIGKQTIGRGDGSAVAFDIGAGRRWGLELVEDNAIFTFRVIWDTDGKRPAETAAARLTWLLGSQYLSTVHDNGLVVYPTDALDANDYRGQFPRDVLNDIGVRTAFLYFAFYDQPNAQISLFFDQVDSMAYRSALRLSNVDGDVDLATTFAVEPTAQLVRDPSRVAAGEYVPFSGGAAYKVNLATSYEFGFRDMVAPTASIKTQAKADAHALLLLGEAGEQDERVTCRTQLPSALLTAIKRGQALQVRFQHFPGWESYRWARVVRKTFAPPANRAQTWYDVDLELSPMRGLPHGAFAVQQSGVAFSGIPRLVQPTTPGRLLVAVLFGSGAITQFPGAFRFLDDPPIAGSAPIPPYSPAQSAAWTVGPTALTDYGEQNIGGPGAGPYDPVHNPTTGGLLVGIAWRRVQPGEVTTHPVAVSTDDGHNETAVCLWEIDTPGDPGASVTANGHLAGNPSTVTLPGLPGNVVAAIFRPTGAGHSGIPTPLSETVHAGTLVQSGQQDSNNPAIGAVSQANWFQVVSLPAGGAVSVELAVDPAYHSLNYAGVAVVLPAGVKLPAIPYPANQTP